MSKVKFTGIRQLDKAIKIKIKAAQKKLLKSVGEFSVRYIKGQTRSGIRLVDGSREKHKALTPFTIRKRGELSKFNATHNTYSQRRSNLTFTGQLIDSLRYKVKGAIVEVFVPRTRRKPYRVSKSKKQKDNPNNQEVAKRLSDMDRSFVSLDRNGVRQVIQLIQRDLRRRLSRRK